jgi:xanthine dehydrogenase molybdenum-binding subunit
VDIAGPAEVAAGRIPWNAEVSEETSVGAVDAGFKQADFILMKRFFNNRPRTSRSSPRSAMAYWRNGRLFLHGSTQSVAQTVPFLARWVGIDPSQVVLVSEYCGGGFGSKAVGANSMAIPALLSRKTGRPVMMRISREEETYIGRMRPGFQARVKIGFRKDGRITAMDFFIIEDSGPYERQGDNEITASIASLLYQPMALRFRGLSVATNTPPRCAQRGPGGMQGASMLEPLISRAARQLGVDEVVIRKINAPSDGSSFGITDTRIAREAKSQPHACVRPWIAAPSSSSGRNGRNTTGRAAGARSEAFRQSSAPMWPARSGSMDCS